MCDGFSIESLYTVVYLNIQVHKITCCLYAVYKHTYSNNFNNNFMYFGRRELICFMCGFGFEMYVCIYKIFFRRKILCIHTTG